jgi:hypothetical protein
MLAGRTVAPSRAPQRHPQEVMAQLLGGSRIVSFSRRITLPFRSVEQSKGTILGVQLRFFSLKSEFDNSEKYRFMLDLGLWFVVARRGCHDALCHAVRVQVVSV